jgi:hypothetical protein
MVRIRKLVYRVAFESLSGDELEAVFDSLRALHGWDVTGLESLWATLPSQIYWSTLKGSFDPQTMYSCWLGLDAGDLDWFVETVPRIAEPDAPEWCSWFAYAHGLSIRVPVLDSILAANPLRMASVLHRIDRGEYGKVEPYFESQQDSIASARAQGDSTQADLHAARVTLVEAYLAWKRDGQAAAAAKRMQSVPARLRGVQMSLPISQMLVESGQPEAAVRALERGVGLGDLTIALYRTAPLYEQLGEPDKARAAYAEFIERWKNADPRLQPMVDTARAALARLGPMDQ